VRPGIFTAVAAFALVYAGGCHAGDCVTLVADLAGSVTVAESASARATDRWPVQLLQCLPARRVVTLEPDARITLFFADGARAFELAGRARYEIASDGVRPLAGARDVAPRPLNKAFGNLRIDRAALAPAGVRMRDPPSERLALIAPLGVVTEPGSVTFRWQPAAGSVGFYRLRLAREPAEVFYDSIVEGDRLTLSPEVKLVPGERIVWHVEEAAAPHRAAPRWQSFVVATEPARVLAHEIDAGASSSLPAERTLRDVLLLQFMTENR
jgi:hypothetical protein